MKPRNGVVHVLFHPVSAKRFVEPLVAALIADGTPAELWVQPVKGTEAFLASLEVPTEICPSNLGINPVKAISAFFMLFARLRRRRPLVIQAHLFRGAFLPLLAAFVCRVPVRIYHNHGVTYMGYRGVLRAMLKTIERFNCLLATHVITVNESLRPALQAVAPRRRTITVYGPGSVCGLDPSEYADSLDPQRKIQARLDLGFGENDLVLLYIGRPHAHKGFPLVIDAFGRLFAERTDVKLLICGCSSADVERVQRRPPPGIRALGYLRDLHPIYRAADAVLLPSLYEGLPYSLLEGAAQGCALLASRIPGPDILVADGHSGFLVAPADVGDLIRALRQMDQNRGQLRIMGAAAYQTSLAFRREAVIGHYLAFMRAVMTAADSRFRRQDAGDKLAA